MRPDRACAKGGFETTSPENPPHPFERMHACGACGSDRLLQDSATPWLGTKERARNATDIEGMEPTAAYQDFGVDGGLDASASAATPKKCPCFMSTTLTDRCQDQKGILHRIA